MTTNLREINRTLFQDPEYSLVSVSPRANWLSFCRRVNQFNTIILQKREQPQQTQTLFETPNTIEKYWWQHQEQYIVLLMNTPGKGPELVWLSIDEEFVGSIQSGQLIKTVLLHPDGDRLFIEMKEPREEYFHLYEYHMQSQKLNKVFDNKKFVEIFFDTNGLVQFAIAFTDNQTILFALKGQDRQKLLSLTQHDILTLHRFPELKPRIIDNQLYLTTSCFSNYSNIYCYNGTEFLQLTDNQSSAKGDISQIVWQHAPIVYQRAHLRRENFAIEPRNQKHLDFIHKTIGPEKDFEIVSNCAESQHWIIKVISSERRDAYYEYNLNKASLNKVCSSNKVSDTVKSFQTYCVEIPTKDNQTYPAYFTEAKSDRAPSVILIHGGPHSREFWGWLPVHQWFAHLGIHSLSVNYRGSTGMGRAAQESANGEWTGAILQDILAAKQWLVENDHANTNQVALFGNSFGGYATMMLMSLFPETFICGIDQMGPGNLVNMLKQLPPGWAIHEAFLLNMMGVKDNKDKAKACLDISPVSHLDKLSRPLLMGYGEKDPIIHASQASDILNQIQQHNKTVTAVILKNQGHQITHEQVRCDWQMLIAAFLSKYLLNMPSTAISAPAGESLTMLQDDFKLLKTD